MRIFGTNVAGETFTSPTISSGVLTLDLNQSSVFNVTLNANITTFNITNPQTINISQSFILVFTADGTPRTVTWGASIYWQDGVAPTLTSTNGKKDVFGFITLDGGTVWTGYVGGQNF